MRLKNTMIVFAAGMASASLALYAANPIAFAQADGGPRHSADRIASYALGWDLGVETLANLNADGVAVDHKLMVSGFSDAMAGANPALGRHDMQLALINFNDEIFERLHEERLRDDPVYLAQARANAEAGAAHRARFAALPNVKSTESGALYRVDRTGDGGSPKLGDFIVANYRIMLLDGTEIGEGDGAIIDTRTMLDVGQELVQRMRVGDKWTIFIAPQGDEGRASRGVGAGPNEAIIAELELLGITDQPDD